MNFKSEYESRIRLIDNYIEEYLDNIQDIDDTLKSGMKYAVLNGGKRLRSILCTEICYAFSQDRKKAMPFASAIELIHAYSLVHDDLPAMDNADTRRGMPSCHRKFGEDIAILIGDALLNTAYELMLEHSNDSLSVSAMKIIADSAGIHGMVNGQMRDLNMLKKENISENDLIHLIEQKTMALIRGAAVSGAVLAGCTKEQVNIVDKYAYNLGMAFQIRDDFEDYTEDNVCEHECPNFINILGFDNAKSKMVHNNNECIKYLRLINNNDFLLGLNEFLFPEVQ